MHEIDADDVENRIKKEMMKRRMKERYGRSQLGTKMREVGEGSGEESGKEKYRYIFMNTPAADCF